MLIRNLTADHVYLACGRMDMRKSIDGLAALVLSKFQLDPHQPALFLFCGRRKEINCLKEQIAQLKKLAFGSRTEKTKKILGEVEVLDGWQHCSFE
ncbi:MAG: IS66 family insertion sequence element accessory protein TnpB [Aeriscardovia sp.]|nr:IS66 family insertion sequence element accessory protein TnpB [Aeriscardovia sp.]